MLYACRVTEATSRTTGAPGGSAAPPPAGVAAGAPTRGVVVAVGVLAALRLAHWLLAPPNSDEAYYWAWGQHPALSYYDHPPLLAWTQGLVHALLGRSELALRLPAALCTVGLVLLGARVAARLAAPGRGRVTFAAAALLGSPLLLMFTSFAWHDALLLFLCALAATLLVDFLAEVAEGGRGSTARLFLGAAVLGLAALAKYNSIFVAVGVAGAIALDPRLRKLFRDPRLWLAAAITLAVLSPIVIWNLDHGLASFRFHLGQRQGVSEGLRLRPRAPVDFLVPTVLLLGPAFVIAAVRAFRTGDPSRVFAGGAWAGVYRRVALLVFASSTAAFLALSLVSWTLYYWNIVAYVLLVPPVAVVLAARPRLLRFHLGYGLVAAAVLVAHAVVIPLTAPFPWIQDDDSKEPLGWPTISQAVAEELARGPGRFPATTDYRSAAHLAWALGTADVVVVPGGRLSQFDYWLDRSRGGGTAVLVTDHRGPMDAGVARWFDRVTHLRTLPVDRLGLRIKTYDLWLAEGFHLPPPAGR
jgi:4-amino-4-deoxy-L-arabinose transferase-like glycosyltransferase